MALRRGVAACAAVVAMATGATRVVADQPVDWQIGFQEPATPIMESISEFNDLLVPIIVIITAVVLALLAYIVVRFNARSNPTPSRTTHNTVLEFAWTVVPIIILVVIAVPSIRLLYYSDRVPEADMTIKATGHQWYWSYEYPDNGGFTFDAVIKDEADLAPDELRLLTTDNHVVLPVATTIRVQIMADDVLHAWAVPAFGVKKDAVPGRLTEVWVRVEREGTYYGQCSELCGERHGYMPIQVEVVSKAAFDEWVVEAQAQFAATAPGPAMASAATAEPARF
ncbi:MAG: cytochrome c oxidase subunit II [Alphaproteobacteria bacterium]